jgi:hypothetical protein
VLGSGTTLNTNWPGGLMALSLKSVSVTIEGTGLWLVVSIVNAPFGALLASENVIVVT